MNRHHSIREARLLTDDLTVPTKCWIYTYVNLNSFVSCRAVLRMFSEQCHQSLAPITNDDPYVYLSNGAGRTVRCYEE